MSWQFLSWQFLMRLNRLRRSELTIITTAIRCFLANLNGLALAAVTTMKSPSAARERTLALQRRALAFSTGVNIACPRRFTNIPSETVWRQLVRAADSVSNNLTEADEAVSGPDFVHKIKLTLREARESRICLEKIRLAKLDQFEAIVELERESGELSAIFATIAMRVTERLNREKEAKKQLKD